MVVPHGRKFNRNTVAWPRQRHTVGHSARFGRDFPLRGRFRKGPPTFMDVSAECGRVGVHHPTVERGRTMTNRASRRIRPAPPADTPTTLPVRPDDIPTVLRGHARWVCWNWVLRRGKWTKPPIDPRTGDKASATDPRTWSTFEVALAHHRKYHERTAGVGFVLGDGYFGVDTDNSYVPETRELKYLARRFLEGLGTYGEISPSATGVKMIGCGGVQLPGHKGIKDGQLGLEVYADGRYFTVTGHVLHGPDVVACGQTLLALLDEIKPGRLRRDVQAGRNRKSVPAPAADLTDEEVIHRMT